MASGHQDYATRAATLESVVSQYQVGSKEYETVRLAGLALYFAMVYHGAEFSGFLETLDRGLTNQEIEFLKGLESESENGDGVQ